MGYKKWKERLIKIKLLDISEVVDLLKDFKNAEENRDRFLDHLDKVAFACSIGWWEGDFPIDEVLKKNEIKY